MTFSDQTALLEGLKRFKVNLHSHTMNSDGHWTPAQSVAAHRAHGYQALCLSEHDLFTDYSDTFDTEDFIILPGLEASAVLWEDESRTQVRATHHIHGILGTDEMVAAAPHRFAHMEHRAITEHVGSWDGRAVAQQLIDELAAHGCAVMYNHPIWSRVDPADVVGLTGAFAIEVYNFGTVDECALGHDTVFWDLMLRSGQRLGAAATDDNHNSPALDDSFGGWVVVAAPELTRSAVVQALLHGHYYSSAGPRILNWGVCDGHAWVECSPCERVNLIAGGSVGVGETRLTAPGELLEHATFALRGSETYLRFECVDAQGKVAWSNPLYPDDICEGNVG